MKTPKERFQADPQFRMLVETMVSFIWNNQFTPSEIRDAAMLACIIYEERRAPEGIVYPEDVINWLNSIHPLYDNSRETSGINPISGE